MHNDGERNQGLGDTLFESRMREGDSAAGRFDGAGASDGRRATDEGRTRYELMSASGWCERWPARWTSFIIDPGFSYEPTRPGGSM
jgi:hypothetical protein